MTEERRPVLNRRLRESVKAQPEIKVLRRLLLGLGIQLVAPSRIDQAVSRLIEDAIAPVADLAKELGFAPVKLGKLNEGGSTVHARGRTWGQLIFQDLFKKEQ